MWSVERIKRNLTGCGRITGEGTDGMTGDILCPLMNRQMHFIASWSEDWEHVSVSTPKQTPSWEAMCFVKDLFWGPEEVVMQLHPRQSEYVNRHKFCLHLWKPLGQTIPTPPQILVG